MARGGETGGPSIQDALDEFEGHGYGGEFRVREGGVLRCLTCGKDSAAEDVQRTALRRVEGVSDPDDMASINALVCPKCGTRGTSVMAYGTHASAAEAEVLQRLNPVHRTGETAPPEGALHPAEAEVPEMPADTDDDVLPPTPHDRR